MYPNLKKMKRRTIYTAIVLSIGILLFMALFVVIFGGGALITDQNCDSDDNTGTTTATSKIGKISVKDNSNYLTKIKNIAKAVGPKVGVSPRLLFAQLYAESGPNGSQPVNVKDHNYGGMTWTAGSGYPKGTTRGVGGSEGGWYRHYKNVSEFASDWAVTVKNNFSDLGYPKSVSDYFQKMKAKGYMVKWQGYQANMETGYKLWTGKSTVANATKTADAGDEDTGEDCDTDSSVASGSIVKEAKKWVGKFYYSYARSANAHWKNPSSSDTTDCSGFVWFVFKRLGIKVPSQVWATPGMESDAKGSHTYLKQISAKDTKAGDVIIVNCGGGSGQDGHTAILLGHYTGNNTKVVEMGGNGNRVNIETIGRSFTSLLARSHRLTFARPTTAAKGDKSSSSSSSSSAGKGLSKAEREAKEWIAHKESTGSYTARNGQYYGRYQLGLSYLAKGSSLGGDGTLSKANQEKVANNYVKQRYGSWVNAKKFWVANGWY